LLLQAQSQSVEAVRECLPKIQAALFKFSSSCQIVALTAICDVLANINPTVMKNPEVWQPIVDCAAALLESPCSTIFASACDLLRMILSVLKGSMPGEGAAENALVGRMVFLTSPKAVRLAALLVRGMFSQTTFAGALWLSGVFCSATQALSSQCLDMVSVICTLICGVLTGLKVFHSSQNGVAFAQKLQAHCGAKNAGILSEAFSHMDESSLPVYQQHTSAEMTAAYFFPAFAKVFSKPEQQLLAIDVIIALLRKGQKRWRPVLLEILAIYLGPPEELRDLVHPLSNSQMQQCFELVVFFSRCPTSPQPLAESANHALMSLLTQQNVPKGFTMRFFDCSRDTPSEICAQDMNPELFSALCPEEAVQLAAHCTQSFAKNVMHDDSIKPSDCFRMNIEDFKNITKAAGKAALFSYDMLTSRRARIQPLTLASDERRPFDKLEVHIMGGLNAQEEFLPATGN